LTFYIFSRSTEYFESLPEDDEVRKSVGHALETLQQDDDRDVRFFSGGKMKEQTISENAEVDFDRELNQRQHMDMIMRGIHEYAITNDNDDDDDDDSELVEEVYIEEHALDGGDMQPGDIIIEEYYAEDDLAAVPRQLPPGTQYYVEEIFEEVIETIGKKPLTTTTTTSTSSTTTTSTSSTTTVAPVAEPEPTPSKTESSEPVDDS